jgi:dTDP-4-dehydrorhamnose 3,5-epimerase
VKKILIKDVQGACLIEFDRHSDERGYFQEIYSTSRDYPHLVGTKRQINLSMSGKGVVRGLHIVPFGKICSCPRGRLFDVIADVRPDSPTYLNWYGVWLEEQSCRQLYVPPHCAHGFFSAEDNTILMYIQDGTYDPTLESEVNWKDPDIGIKWPEATRYILSAKDLQAPIIKKLHGCSTTTSSTG